MSRDKPGTVLSHKHSLQSAQEQQHKQDHSVLLRRSQEAENEQGHILIRAQLRQRLSEYGNDTAFQSELMSRFYHKYSASQDYYYSNVINNILAEAQVSPVIRWMDVQTELDDDEYLKRYYEAHEYEHKVRLLSEYYKFHKDIPRFFAQPTCRRLNEYHEKKRKIDYHRIKQILVQEAAKKNKKVAMNDNDNEIR